MNDKCTPYEDMIEWLLADELPADRMGALLAHASGCQECRHLLTLHFQLSSPEFQHPESVTHDLDSVRSAVIQELRNRQGEGLRETKTGLRFILGSIFTLPRLAVAGYSVALLAAGLFLGNNVWRLGTAVGIERFNGERQLLSQVAYEARSNDELRDSKDSPYLFSNVTVERLDEDRLALSFDVTRHLDVVRSANDPLVKEVLVQSLLNPSNVGTRLKAINYADQIFDPKVKQALLFAIQQDENQAVRLKALTTLLHFPNDSEIEQVCIGVLEKDESVPMRMLAIDYLAKGDDGSKQLRDFLSRPATEKNMPVRLRAAHYLQ